jgi:hypothetical protein
VLFKERQAGWTHFKWSGRQGEREEGKEKEARIRLAGM